MDRGIKIIISVRSSSPHIGPSRTRPPEPGTQPSMTGSIHCLCHFIHIIWRLQHGFKSTSLAITSIQLIEESSSEFTLCSVPVNRSFQILCLPRLGCCDLKIPLASYRYTDQSSLLCHDGIPYKMEMTIILYFSGNVLMVIYVILPCIQRQLLSKEIMRFVPEV